MLQLSNTRKLAAVTNQYRINAFLQYHSSLHIVLASEAFRIINWKLTNDREESSADRPASRSR